MKRKWAIWVSAGMLILGLAVILYPTVSSFINRQNGSYAIQQMRQQLNEMDSEEMRSALKAAKVYNEHLQRGNQPDEDQYDSILDFGNGIMGFITIEKIHVELPIYHGVSTEVLEKGVGHLPSSAFPVGGMGNHTVLTGHTGLPSARLFTDLEKLIEGDLFQVTVGDHTASYQVDQILITLPQETEELMPAAGEDYCTLVTCTPYGVNSHRLLIRGSRVELSEEQEEPAVIEENVPKRNTGWLWLLMIPALGLLIPIIRKKGKHG